MKSFQFHFISCNEIRSLTFESQYKNKVDLTASKLHRKCVLAVHAFFFNSKQSFIKQMFTESIQHFLEIEDSFHSLLNELTHFWQVDKCIFCWRSMDNHFFLMIQNGNHW